MTARKIMKRGGIGADNLAVQLLAKDDADDSRDKRDLTREERESRYKEARARIFRDFKEESLDSTETSAKTSDKDVSRSSSATGAKKIKKKKARDDEFEPRSAFTGVGPFSPPSAKPGSDGTFYNPFAPYAIAAQQGVMATHFNPNQQAQMQMQMQSQYGQPPNPGWPQQQSGQAYMLPSAAPGYPSSGYYDNSGVYNGMPSPNMASQLTPRPTHQTLSSQMPNFNQQDDNPGWNQNYASQYSMQNTMMNHAFLDSNMMSNPMLYSMNPGYAQDQQAMAQAMEQQAAYGFLGHPARQQFNPKTQSFVPGVWGGAMPPMPNDGTYMQNPAMSPMPHNLNSVPLNFQQHQQQQHFNQPLNSSTRTVGQSRSSSGSNQPSRSLQSSSIAKWGTPSTLPPKPPTILPATLPAKPPPPASFSSFAVTQNQQTHAYTNSGIMKGTNGSAAKVGALR